MPTQSTTYNSRVTDEALEKRFRDTFRAQGGAELVDDLYAQGVIVPVVDFTAAATGQQLAENLQTAWDFSTGFDSVTNTTTTIINNAGFWQIGLTASCDTNVDVSGSVVINSGITTKTVWSVGFLNQENSFSEQFNVFLRSGDSCQVISNSTALNIRVWYRQIATLSGDLVNPFGFTSS